MRSNAAESAIRQEFIRAFMRLAMTIGEAEALFAKLLRDGDLEGFIREMSLERPITDKVAQRVIAEYIKSGSEFISQVKLPRSPAGMRVVGYFNPSIPRAQAWTAEAVARLVTRVSLEQKEMIRQLISEGISEGVNPNALVRRVCGVLTPGGGRTGGVLGLSHQQERALKSARAELEELNPNYFTRKMRDKRFDREIKKAMDAGKPLTAAQIEKVTSAQASKMLTHRAETIARTEYHSAVEGGKFDAMETSIEEGKVKRQSIKKIWDSTGHDGHTRQDHLAMEGQTRGWDEPFEAPDGSMMRFPGDRELGASGRQTIRCRCVMKVKVDRYAGLT